MKPTFLAAALGMSLAAMSAAAHDYTVGDLHIAHPWARATPAGATTGGAYMMITNPTDRADRLIGGSAEIAERVEIHHMSVENDVMRMRQLEGGLEISAGGEVTLEPGGYHVMLIGLSAPLDEGERVPMTLEFAEAGQVEVDLAIEAMGAGEEAAHQH